MAVTRVSFVGGPTGEWKVERILAVHGESLRPSSAVERIEGAEFVARDDVSWILTGVRSAERYIERAERDHLGALQQGLGRPDAGLAALIPIRKKEAWWDLAQDERRAIFEARSRHIAIGAEYLPAIARRLYHCRELGGPFDFLTWFEFAEGDAGAFDELVGRLRETEEWRYVDREVEIRVRR
jgi:chlorite dismutase